jgi:hypothetical protein
MKFFKDLEIIKYHKNNFLMSNLSKKKIECLYYTDLQKHIY